MWQIEYIREIMKEHVEKRTFYMYLPRIREITNEDMRELARMDINYGSYEHRYWYSPRVDINKENCEEIMDLFMLVWFANEPWAKTQMRALNKQFKNEFFKLLYKRRRESFRNLCKEGEIENVLVPEIP